MGLKIVFSHIFHEHTMISIHLGKPNKHQLKILSALIINLFYNKQNVSKRNEAQIDYQSFQETFRVNENFKLYRKLKILLNNIILLSINLILHFNLL